MHEHPTIIFVAILIFVFGLFSRLTEKMPITAPMVFVAVGIILSPIGIDFVKVEFHATLVRVIAELTLILILFSDALTIDYHKLIRDAQIPSRLLFIGLPITMVLGVALGVLIFDDIGFWLTVLLAFILSPTDAALGQAVVKSNVVPERIRGAIGVESGLNDGLVLPPILICIAAHEVVTARADAGIVYWIGFTLHQLILGPLAGAIVGWLGGLLVTKAVHAGWMNATYKRLTSVALAIMAYTLAESVHGNGFIASFFAGMMLGTRYPTVRKDMEEFGELEGQLLELFIFLILGLILVPMAVSYWDGKAWLYAVLSLTVIRMLPVALCLIGAKLDISTIAFIGWFGPRGIASVLYLLMLIGTLGYAGYERMMSIVVLTVLLSVFLHGITAVPFARWYAKNRAF